MRERENKKKMKRLLCLLMATIMISNPAMVFVSTATEEENIPIENETVINETEQTNHDEKLDNEREEVTEILSPQVASAQAQTLSGTVYDVTTFGANGADTGDDSAAIQAALNLATNELITVYVPSGTYYIQDTLMISSNTRLRLDTDTILVNTDVYTSMLVGRGDREIGGHDQINNIHIEGGTWDGNDLLGEFYQGIMFLRHGTNISIKNTTLKNATNHFLNLSGTKDALVENVVFKDMQEYTGSDSEFWEGVPQSNKVQRLNAIEAIHLDYTHLPFEPNAFPHDDTPCVNITIRDCVFEDVYSGVGTHHDLPDVYSTNIVIENNTFKNILYTCISSYSYNELSVKGNIAENATSFLIALNSEGSVSNNSITGAFQGEFEATPSQRMRIQNSKLSISENIIDGGERSAIYAADNSKVTINNNTIKNCNEIAISLVDAQGDISENTLESTGLYGIRFNSSTGTITKNIIKDVNGHGISIENSEIYDFSENKISNTLLCGIYGRGFTGKINKNNIQDAKDHAIRILESQNFSVVENEILRATISGISLKDNQSGSIIANKIDTTGENGVFVETNTGLIVTENSIKNATTNGVRIINLSEVEVLKNEIDTIGAMGISVDNNTKISITDNDISNTERNGIYVRNVPELKIDNNRLSACGRNNAMGLEVTGCNGAKIIKNSVISSGRHGIYLTSSNGAVISENTASKNLSDGIYVFQCENIELLNNIATENENRGIAVSASKNVNIIENTVTDNKGAREIEAFSESSGVIKSNRVETGKIVVASNSNFEVSNNSMNTTFTVEYHANGGSGNMPSTKVTFGTSQALRANTFTNAGYAFAGWNAHRRSDNKWLFVNASGTEGWYEQGKAPTGYQLYVYRNQQNVARTSKVDRDVITMHAVWGTSTFTIQYNANGGSGNMASTNVTFGTSQALRANTFTNAGHTFAGWNVHRQSDNKRLFVNASGTEGWYEQGKEPTGYSLYVYRNQQNVARTSRVDKDVITMQAVWSVNTFTVQYNSNGGSGSMASTNITFGTSQALRTNTFTNTGYTFAGWNAHRRSDNKWLFVNASGTEGWYEQGKAPTGYKLYTYRNLQNVARTSRVNKDIVTMHAVWQTNTFTVQYSANGGSGLMASTNIIFGTSQALRANTFINAGHTFMGWNVHRRSDNKWLFVNSIGLEGWYEQGKAPTGYKLYAYHNQQNVARTSRIDKDVVTMHAVWNANTFTVQYNANGGSGSMGATTVQFGISQALRTNSFTNAGHTFAGWNVHRQSDNKRLFVNDSGTEGWYEQGKAPAGYKLYTYRNQQNVARTSRVNKDTITMHAVWNTNVFTVQYNANGGRGTMANTSVTFGTSQALRANTFTNTGRIFAGWNVHRRSDNRWLFVNASGTEGWYEQGKAPAGYNLYVYRNQQNVARTSRVDKDIVTMHAVWR